MRLCRKCGDTSECEHDWLELPDEYVASVDEDLSEVGLVTQNPQIRDRIQEIRDRLNESYKYFLEALALAVEGSHDEAARVFQESVRRIKRLESWSVRQSANFRLQHTLSWMREIDES